MLSFDHRSIKNLSVAILAIGALMLAGACTVRPLYEDTRTADGQGATEILSSIEVKPVKTRQALEVRNHLIFLLTGGAGQPAKPEMVLVLDVSSLTASAATVQIATDNEPSAGTVTMTAEYTLKDSISGETVSKGKRISIASYDKLRQEFATLRAVRDAENRAARELAERLRLAIVHDLETRGTR